MATLKKYYEQIIFFEYANGKPWYRENRENPDIRKTVKSGKTLISCLLIDKKVTHTHTLSCSKQEATEIIETYLKNQIYCKLMESMFFLKIVFLIMRALRKLFVFLSFKKLKTKNELKN